MLAPTWPATAATITGRLASTVSSFPSTKPCSTPSPILRSLIPALSRGFNSADHRWDIEPSAYIQDQIHLGNWNISAGLRFDHYGFVVHESAWSPRLGISRYIPFLNLLLHASYDRVFQTPAMENLLLASSAQLNAIDPVVLRLPVRPARGNYYEGGFTKSIFGKLRIDANIFRRDFHNYPDDDTLLDTGVSFPISFASARIFGEELRLEVPQWWRFSGFLSYSNQSGIARGPITGGLFLGSDAARLPRRRQPVRGLPGSAQYRSSPHAFPGRTPPMVRPRWSIRQRPACRSWVDSDDQVFLLAQYGPAILSRENFARQRVRPNFSLDIAAGAQLYRKELRSLALQVQVSNVTDHVNVLNFASLFSGTAVAVPRSASASLKLTF